MVYVSLNKVSERIVLFWKSIKKPSDHYGGLKQNYTSPNQLNKIFDYYCQLSSYKEVDGFVGVILEYGIGQSRE